ncbi:MAG TPA: hypothetical protein PKD00_10225 [Burkholderiales bacterium]|nr:hypothetical protein [Burkholderiales bacterium]
MNINTKLIKPANKPNFNYKAVSTSVKSKTIYINQIIDNIESREDVALFKKVLEDFVEQTRKFKYENFNKWFNYDKYEEYMKDSRVKVQIWINNLIRISRHRNFKLFGIASDTQSLEEVKQIFYYKKRTSYDYKYITKRHLKKIEAISSIANRRKEANKDVGEELIEGSNKIFNQLKYDNLWNISASKKEILEARVAYCLKYKTNRLNLRNLNLVEWPYELSQKLSHIEELDLSMNKIFEIPEGAIEKLKNLRTINLIGNPIKKILPNTWKELEKLPKLKKLNINHKIPKPFFQSLIKLETITIKDFYKVKMANYEIKSLDNNIEILREEKI